MRDVGTVGEALVLVAIAVAVVVWAITDRIDAPEAISLFLLIAIYGNGSRGRR